MRTSITLSANFGTCSLTTAFPENARPLWLTSPRFLFQRSNASASNPVASTARTLGFTSSAPPSHAGERIMAAAYDDRFSLGQLLEGLFPPLDRIRTDQSGVVLCCAIAHAERIAIGEIFGDVAIVGERNMGALSRQADMVTAIHFVAMRKQPDSGSLAAANSGIQHGYLPQWIRAVQPLWPPAGMEATASHEEICGHLRISRASGKGGCA